MFSLILIKPAKTWCNVNEITLVCTFAFGHHFGHAIYPTTQMEGMFFLEEES